MKKLTEKQFLKELKARNYDMRTIGDYTVTGDCTLDLRDYKKNLLVKMYFGNGTFTGIFTWDGHIYFTPFCGSSTFEQFDCIGSCNHFHCENAVFKKFGNPCVQANVIAVMHFDHAIITEIDCASFIFRACFLDDAQITYFYCHDGIFDKLDCNKAQIGEFFCDRATFGDVFAQHNPSIGMAIHVYKTSNVRISNTFFVK